MSEAIINDLKKRMDNSFTSLKNNFSSVRAGRASPNLLDNISVDVYGSPMPINQVATVSVADNTLLTVQVWDKGNVDAVIKAISTSNLGINPSNEGTLVRVPLPKLSEERRLELGKICAGYAEQGKVAIRNIRRDGIDSIKKLQKDSEISEDQLHADSDRIQKITDEVIKNIEDSLKAKTAEIVSV
jgi:ribosome recycling factor